MKRMMKPLVRRAGHAHTAEKEGEQEVVAMKPLST